MRALGLKTLPAVAAVLCALAAAGCGSKGDESAKIAPDRGATWVRFGSGLPLVEVTDLYLSSDSPVRAATFGRGFWELMP